MNKISKFLPYFILNIIIGIIVCIAVSFYLPIKKDLLPPFLFAWRFRKAILFFIFYAPFIFISSLIIAYTIIFGKHGPLKMPPHSVPIMKFIRSFFIIIISVSVIYIVLCEVVKPILIEQQEHDLQMTVTYNEYKKLSQDALKRKEYQHALAHVKRAISIWPESEEAIKMQENIKISCSECLSEEKVEIQTKDDDALAFKTEYTAEKALETAEQAMIKFDFYTAHYYAKLAYNSFPEDEPLKQTAEKLAEQAWSEIEKGKAKYLDQPQIDHFRKKRQAYQKMQAGNFIDAYYDFLELHKELCTSESDKKDPEIERFLQLSKEKLLDNVFFTDELDNIPNFAVNKNIEFAIDVNKGTYAKIYGISRLMTKKGQEIYLMNTEIMQKIDHRKIWSIKVPVAKIKIKNENELLMQIKAVDRTDRTNSIEPEILSGDYPVKTTYNITLPFGISDFNMIEDAALGADKMKLIDLYYFIARAKKYGFKKSTFIREFIARLAEPLLALIVSIFAVILAWKFRLTPGKRFKKRWWLAAPLCIVLAYVLIEGARYLCKLQIAIFVNLTPTYAPYIIFSVLIALFIGLTIRLSSMSAE